MKAKTIEDLKDGMWCRLASGEVWTWECRWLAENRGPKHYTQALIDMGAEWYPRIPDGYRLATAEDRKGEKPDDVMFTDCSMSNWGGVARGGGWGNAIEYIVPIKPKVYEVRLWSCVDNGINVGRDFEPGDRVTVQKVDK